MFERNAAEIERIFLRSGDIPKIPLGLREGQNGRRYQHEAVEMWYRRGSLLLATLAGSGRPMWAGWPVFGPGCLPAAIVVEAHLQRQWKQKLEAFSTLRCYCVKGTNPKNERLPGGDVYIFRYSQIRGWSDVFDQMGIPTVIFDEIQKLRTGTGEHVGSGSDMGKAAMILADRATRRLGLTGSPIYGYGIEIFNVLQFIDPNVPREYYDFVREWVSDSGT